MKVSKNTLASYVVSLTIIALVVTVLYLIIYVLLGAPRLLFIRVSIIMAALSANDYFRQWLRRRSSDPDSEVVYAEIIRIGNSLKSVQWIRMQPPWLLFGITFAWIILSSLLVSLIGGPLPDMMIGKETIRVILVGLVIGPIIETLLFQVFIIETVKRISPKVDGQYNLLFPTLVSAIFFGIAHGYSANYIVYAFLMGVGLSSLYILVSVKPGMTWKNGFWMVVLLHLSMNFLAFLEFLASVKQ